MTKNGYFWASLAYNIGPFVLAFAGILYNLYLRYFCLDKILEALSNSRYSYTWAPALRRQGWLGCMLLTAHLSGMILIPGPALRSGELSAIDLKAFPPHLKLKIKIVASLMIGGFIWLISTSIFPM